GTIEIRRKILNVGLRAVFLRGKCARNRSSGFLQEARRDCRINQQSFSMLYRAAPDFLGRVENDRTYPPPEAIHRANGETTIRRPCASVHKRTILSPGCAGWARTGRADQLRFVLDCSKSRAARKSRQSCLYLLRVPTFGKCQSKAIKNFGLHG